MKKIPKQSYRIIFDIETVGDEFFREKRTIKEIKDMVYYEFIGVTNFFNIDRKTLKVNKI